MSAQQQRFNTEMSTIDQLKQSTAMGMNQIQEFKDQTTEQIDKTVEGYRQHVMALEAPQNQMQIDMIELKRKMEQLTEECDMRAASQGTIDQRIEMLFSRIAELKNEKEDKKKVDKLDFFTKMGFKNTKYHIDQLEDSLRNTVDYMLRYQWKETRNICNRAIAKVIRPLQLKDLFFCNVAEANPELFYAQSNQNLESKALDAVPATNNVTPLDHGLTSESRISRPSSGLEAPQLKHQQQSKGPALKVPNLLITDFKFAPNDDDNSKRHPILGTVEVRNLNEIDWQALKNHTVNEWSSVCQEHFNEVAKLGKAAAPSDLVGLTRKSSRRGDISQLK